MFRIRRLLFVFIVLASLLPLGAALAKEIVLVTITGLGLEAALEISDREQLALFERIRYDDGMIALPPTDPAGPHFEIRTSVGAGDEIVATNVHHFYFTSNGGYMYYADVEGGWTDAEQTWFRLSAESDRELRDFLAGQGADIEGGSMADSGWLLALWDMIMGLLG